jgi:hypothetical protein
MKKVRSIFFVAIVLCFCNFSLSKSLSQKDAELVAQDIFASSVDQSIEDAEAIANIIGSMIIREIKDGDEEASESERNKLKVTAAAGYIASLIINHVKSKRNQRARRSSLLGNKQQYLIDQITEKLVEMSNEY